MGAIVPCTACDARPVAQCARCETTLCARHRPRLGRRCHRCERDYADGASGRNWLKFLLAVPTATFAAAVGLALLLPITGPGLVGSIVVAWGAATAATGAGGAVVIGIERTARAQFLREHGRALPEARVVRRLLPPHG
ncbi:MAG TPA: hypothetical protein VHE35_03540 [Kofleriaceae bacterium]|nr:hypothetical protein [Kofleriaceae bacterium]